MKKIILSVNSNCDYSWYTPLAVWTWQKIGWNVFLFYHNGQFHEPFQEVQLLNLILENSKGVKFTLLPQIEGYRSDTITQISRLYGTCVSEPSDYLMTGDIDLIPLSDAWQFDPEDITIWNYDLTDYTQIPIGYVGMKAGKWTEVMGLSGKYYDMIKRDLDAMPNAKESTPWEQRWSVDQQLLTKRLYDTQFEKKFIDRGKYPNGYAKYRVDRGDWRLDHEKFIDAHLPRDCYKKSDQGFANFAKVMTLLDKIWPEEDFTWLREYTKEFQKLAQNG